jgi:phospholipase/carboxylesterase
VVARARTTILLVLLVIVAAPGWSCRDAERPASSLDVVERVVAAADPDAPLPVLIAVHGLGDTPESFCGFIAGGVDRPARILCPRAPQAWGHGYSWFPPPSTAADFGDLAAGIERAGEQVAALARSVGARPSTVGHPLLVGYSQGGMIAYYVAMRHAQLLSAVVPIAGMLPPSLRRVPQGPEIPVFAFHGLVDELVPYAEARATVDALRSGWPHARLQQYAGVGHRLSETMRADVFATLDDLLAAAD